MRFAPTRGRDVPLFVAGAADLLESLLRDAAVRRDRRWSRRSARAPTRSARSSRAATSNSSASRTGGARICRSRAASTISTLLRYEYYRDRDVGFEGFTGQQLPVPRGVHLAHLGDALRFPGAQRRPRQARRHCPTRRRPARRAGCINTRREKFKDPRVREAMAYAFDFEWTNKNLMYGSYERTHSVFQNSDMMAKGKPSPEELALLEPFRGKVPDEVFGEPFVPPVSRRLGPGPQAAAQRRELLNAAGWTVKDGKRRQRQGRAAFDRIPARRARRSSRITRPSSRTWRARHRGHHPRWSIRCSTERAVKDFDFDIAIAALQLSADAGRRAAQLFLQRRSPTTKGSQQSRRDCRSRRSTRWSTRSIAAQTPAELDDRLPRARPRAARRPLLGSALVQGVALDRLLGHVRPSRRPSRAMRAACRKPGGTTPAKAAKTRAGEIDP